MEKRESEFILQYLRNITSKISTLFERIEALNERVEKFCQACGQAFHQTKVVVNRLAEATEETRKAMRDLSIDNLLAVLAGEEPPACVNPAVLG